MKPQTSDEILNAHYDALTSQNVAKARLIETDPTVEDDMPRLFALVRLLWETLQPLSPEERFRLELHRSLVDEAQRRRVQQALGIETRRKTTPVTWIVPVAAIGTASLVGAYVFWRRSRHSLGEGQAALAA